MLGKSVNVLLRVSVKKYRPIYWNIRFWNQQIFVLVSALIFGLILKLAWY